jgi:aminopeptidase N
MLRKRVGDRAFWEGIRTYYARHMNGTASTADFMRAMEEASGMDHATFFDQWLRQGGNPELGGWWDYDPATGAIEIALAQVQDIGSYVMPLEIGVYMEGEDVPAYLETVEIGRDALRFVIPVEGEPSEVRLDPNTWALFRAEFGRRAPPGG